MAKGMIFTWLTFRGFASVVGGVDSDGKEVAVKKMLLVYPMDDPTTEYRLHMKAYRSSPGHVIGVCDAFFALDPASHACFNMTLEIGEIQSFLFYLGLPLRTVLQDYATQKKEALITHVEALAQQANECLVALHAVRIVHKDIKPDNFLFSDGY
jgi:serine/threonine protein kinase